MNPRPLAAILLTILCTGAGAAPKPNLHNNITRPLRYQPEGGDFVIRNGRESFNRPLYGGNTGFRIDGGDRPEFSLFLPGRGGNLRFGIASGTAPNREIQWLISAKTIVSRYRSGAMVYEIQDDLLGAATLTLTVIPTAASEGVIAKAELAGSATPLQLVWAFGGANGDRGRRNGDLRAENLPISQFFQLRPEFCKGNSYDLRPDATFTLRSKAGTIIGTTPAGAKNALADSVKWASPKDLFASAGKAASLPVLVGEAPLCAGKPLFLALRKDASGKAPALAAADLPAAFAAAEKFRTSLADSLGIVTPDPFVNAAAQALGVAADAVWDEKQGIYQHGANGWRVNLLGWRAAYTGDALGRHDRTRRHLEAFAPLQNNKPVPDRIPPADEKFNLARNEAALHSNGNLTDRVNPNHYDMNLVAIDTFFRHLLWTGDLAFAAKMWPVLERHMDWERRLFRRPFGPGKLPLYEGYACIWASDELIYNGGGVTHASAYNYWHNRMTARLAKLLGKDPAPYQKEAELIRKAMAKELWLEDRGWFAEFKDYLGRQSVHPSAGLWTFYHTLDSQVPSPRQAWEMSRFVDTRNARIPLRGPGVPPGFSALPTTDWMPYVWSVNNVALAESTHTALAYWQANRPPEAFAVLKGALLDIMFMSTCPGNVGMTTPADVFSGERYRDFSDGAGILSRALVEGLFGIKPDALAGEITISPGFPAAWDHAEIKHPGVSLAFKRDGLKESYVIGTRMKKPMTLRLQIPALRELVSSVTVNGRPAKWSVLEGCVGTPRIEITTPGAETVEIAITWAGNAPLAPAASQTIATGESLRTDTSPAVPHEISDPQRVLQNPAIHGSFITGTLGGTIGHRTIFARVTQGDLTWWHPVSIETRAPFELIAAKTQDPEHLRFHLRNHSGSDLSTKARILIDGRMTGQTLEAKARSESGGITLPAGLLTPGTQRIHIDLGDGRRVSGSVPHWKPAASPESRRFETVDITPHFNGQVARIFKNEYRSPRSPFCSLALPKQGIGGWCHYQSSAVIDDSGLRALAGKSAGTVQAPFGVPFATPAAAETKNIAFTSLWDNYPDEIAIPLKGRASRAYLLMAGTTNHMQSRFDNGQVVATYADGSSDTLTLHSPTNWWPIDQDYFIDDFAYARPEPCPPRLDLKSGTFRMIETTAFRGKGGPVPGGAATVLDLPLDPRKELKSLTLKTTGNEVIIGLMSLTLARTP